MTGLYLNMVETSWYRLKALESSSSAWTNSIYRQGGMAREAMWLLLVLGGVCFQEAHSSLPHEDEPSVLYQHPYPGLDSQSLLFLRSPSVPSNLASPQGKACSEELNVQKRWEVVLHLGPGTCSFLGSWWFTLATSAQPGPLLDELGT